MCGGGGVLGRGGGRWHATISFFVASHDQCGQSDYNPFP